MSEDSLATLVFCSGDTDTDVVDSSAEFIKKTVAFLRHVEQRAKTAGVSMAKVLTDVFPLSDETRAAVQIQVPWISEVGLLTFQRQPRGSAKGKMHITQLSFAESGYPGQGVYLGDAILILEQRGLQDLSNTTITVRPCAAGADLSRWGWMPDGSIANGSKAFALSALALFSVAGRWQHDQFCRGDPEKPTPWPADLKWSGLVPEKVCKALQEVSAQFVKHDNLQARVLSNLIETAVNSKTNRSIEDPIFLSGEMLRNSMKDYNVKTVMNLYKQRSLSNPLLKLKDAVLDAALRFMVPGKVGAAAKALLAAHVAEKSWQQCAFSAHALMASRFPCASALANWYDELLVKEGVQSSCGQALAIEIAISIVGDGQITQMDFDSLCGSCGMWVVIKEHVLPQLAFGSSDIEKLNTDFRETVSHRSQIATLTCKEPTQQLSNFMDLAKWVLDHVNFIRLAKEAKAAQCAQTGANHPSSILNIQEQVELNAGVYQGQLLLDVNMYREASEKLQKNSKATAEQMQQELDRHRTDVRSAQDYYQLSDVRVEPVFDGKPETMRGGAWVERASVAARKNREKVCKLVGVGEDNQDLAVLNIIALNSLGTLKTQILDKFRVEYKNFPGVTLVMFPLVPTGVYQSNGDRGSGSVAAVGADMDMDDQQDPDKDELSHDFNTDTLPEAITKAVAKMTSKQRIVQLTKDHDVVKRTLVNDNPAESHYAKGIHCAHVEDGVGARETTEGILLIPAADAVMTGFENATAVKSGMFTGVPTSVSYVAVNKKVAMQAKRALFDDWKFTPQTVATPKYCQSKVARGQFGEQFYKHVLLDFIKNCSRKFILINDFVMGCGECGVAAVGAKYAEEATTAGVRVFYWGHEHRRTYHEVGKARIATCVGQGYLDGKLVIQGRGPVPTPAERTTLRRAQIASLLAKPLAQLTINGEGDLILPNRGNIPVTMTQQLANYLEELEEEFPQPVAPAPTPTPNPSPNPNPNPAAAVGADLLPPGTEIADRATLAGLGWSIIKESNSGVSITS